MSKLLTALIAAGFGLGLNVAMAQNVDSDKANAQGQDKGRAAQQNSSSSQQGQPNADGTTKADQSQPGNAQSANTSPRCAKLSGKEKDKCLQATPAGTVDVRTGEGNKAKTETAKDRDRAKAQAEGQTDGNAKEIPAQSNDTVGHPEERSTTGEGQTLREPGGTTNKGPNSPSK